MTEPFLKEIWCATRITSSPVCYPKPVWDQHPEKNIYIRIRMNSVSCGTINVTDYLGDHTLFNKIQAPGS